MKKMSLLIAATFAASLFFAGIAAAQMSSPGSSEQQSGSQSEQMKSQPGQSAAQPEQQMQEQSGQSQQQQAQSKQGQQQLSSDEIRQLQQQLQAQGHNPGKVDGVMGPKTAKAIREFQQAQGISASGQPDSQTLQALGVQPKGQEEFMGVSPGFEGEQQKEQQQQQKDQLQQEQQKKDSMDQMQPSQQQQPRTQPGGAAQ